MYMSVMVIALQVATNADSSTAVWCKNHFFYLIMVTKLLVHVFSIMLSDVLWHAE